MKFLSLLLATCLNCKHYVPIFCGHNWELSECKKYNRHADMCRMDEGKCGKDARHFSPKENYTSSIDSSFSMELDCI